MTKLTDNTVVQHPETGAPTPLLAGEDVPDWAQEFVGDHLIEGKAQSGPKPRSGAR